MEGSQQTFVNEGFGDHGPPKKRQRMSVVCLNCKARKIKCDKKRPSCSNCERCNVGHMCRYEAPHWVNKVITAESKSETTLLPQVSPDLSQNNESMSRESSLQDEVKMLKDRLEGIEKNLFENNTTSSRTIKREFDEDSINFYTSYNSLNIKRSGMEDMKPLCSSSMTKKDLFLGLVHGYFFLCESLFGAAARRRVKGDAKRLDNSLISILELLGESESPALAPVIAHLVEKKFSTNLSKDSIFPISSIKKVLKPVDDEIKKEATIILPPKSIIKLHLKRFFKYVYPLYPIIDEESFTDKILNTILQSSDDESPITLNLDDKANLSLVATLLIILRLSYITIGNKLSPEEQKLSKFPINGHFIFLARTILSQYQVLRKSNLSILQSLLLLRIYLMFSPEDGDGSNLNHSQNFSGLIIQSAYSIGLNRDFKTNVKVNQTPAYANLWTKIWHTILELDRIGSILSGQSCLIQNENSYELRFPNSAESDSLIESAILSELPVEHRFQLLLVEVSNMVNNLNSPTKVSDVLSLLNKLEVFLVINYSLDSLKLLAPDNEDGVSYKNIRIVKNNIIVKALSLMIYQSISLHFESKEYFNLVKQQHFQYLYTQTAVDLSGIISSYLTNTYEQYIDPNFNYYLNIMIENTTSRVINAFISIIARLHQAKQFFNDILHRKDPILTNTLTNLIKHSLRSANGLNTLLQRKLGRTHYQAFKSSITYKYYLRSLHKEGSKVISDTRSFLTTDSVEKRRLSDKMTGEHGFMPERLTNLENLNSFLHYETNDFENLLEVIKMNKVLKITDACSEKTLWATSFDDIAPTRSGIDGIQVGGSNGGIRQNFSGQGNGSNSGPVDSITPESDFQFNFSGLDTGLLTLDQILSGDLLNVAAPVNDDPSVNL